VSCPVCSVCCQSVCLNAVSCPVQFVLSAVSLCVLMLCPVLSSLFCLLSVCVSVGYDSSLFLARARVRTSALRQVTLALLSSSSEVPGRPRPTPYAPSPTPCIILQSGHKRLAQFAYKQQSAVLMRNSQPVHTVI
jgi:hypothetical protein